MVLGVGDLLLSRAALIMKLTDGWQPVLFSEDMKFLFYSTLSLRISFWQARSMKIKELADYFSVNFGACSSVLL